MNEHHWNIALVILSLLTLVLTLTTFIVIACIKRENKRFFKRFAQKSSSYEEEEIDVDLQNVMMKLSSGRDKENTRCCWSHFVIIMFIP